MQTEKVVREYMKNNASDHVDLVTLEINMTALAEDACTHFNDFDESDNIPEIYFEIAFEISEVCEKEMNVAYFDLDE